MLEQERRKVRAESVQARTTPVSSHYADIFQSKEGKQLVGTPQRQTNKKVGSTPAGSRQEDAVSLSVLYATSYSQQFPLHGPLPKAIQKKPAHYTPMPQALATVTAYRQQSANVKMDQYREQNLRHREQQESVKTYKQ